MENFKKLSRGEMKKIIGGVGGGCGGCSTSGGCSASNLGQACLVGLTDAVCSSCKCNNVTYYPCQVF